MTVTSKKDGGSNLKNLKRKETTYARTKKYAAS